MVRFNSKKLKEFIDSKEGERNHTTSRLFKALFGSKKLNLFRWRLGSNMCYVLFSFNILGKMIQFDPYFSYFSKGGGNQPATPGMYGQKLVIWVGIFRSPCEADGHLVKPMFH